MVVDCSVQLLRFMYSINYSQCTLFDGETDPPKPRIYSNIIYCNNYLNAKKLIQMFQKAIYVEGWVVGQ